jgi:hypothetical protein
MPEPRGFVTLSPTHVAKLRDFMARANDMNGATAQERGDARCELVGYLDSVLRFGETAPEFSRMSLLLVNGNRIDAWVPPEAMGLVLEDDPAAVAADDAFLERIRPPAPGV